GIWGRGAPGTWRGPPRPSAPGRPRAAQKRHDLAPRLRPVPAEAATGARPAPCELDLLQPVGRERAALGVALDPVEARRVPAEDAPLHPLGERRGARPILPRRGGPGAPRG